jgi:hypothetical protein
MFSNPFASSTRNLTCASRRVSRKRRRGAEAIRPAVASCQPLEARTMLAAVTVSTLNDAVNGDVSNIAALQADDGGDGISLREAIEAANNTSGEDVIDFDAALAGNVITLGGSQLEVTDDLVIAGPGAGQLTVDANDQSRVLQIDASASVQLSGLTISGGFADETVGGGIINFGTLAIANSIVTDNHAELTPPSPSRERRFRSTAAATTVAGCAMRGRSPSTRASSPATRLLTKAAGWSTEAATA